MNSTWRRIATRLTRSTRLATLPSCLDGSGRVRTTISTPSRRRCSRTWSARRCTRMIRCIAPSSSAQIGRRQRSRSSWGATSACPDELIIPDHRYPDESGEGTGADVRMALAMGAYIGIHRLQHAGFCSTNRFGRLPRFPSMGKWLQDGQSPGIGDGCVCVAHSAARGLRRDALGAGDLRRFRAQQVGHMQGCATRSINKLITGRCGKPKKPGRKRTGFREATIA